jgi:hypothetical protein
MRAHALAALAALLAACAPSETPSITNPAPEKFVRVHGTVDDSLTVRVTTQHLTTLDRCARDTERGSSPQAQWINSAVTRAADSYEATVTLDHFAPAGCGWQPFLIAFEVTNDAGLGTGYFTTDTAGTRHVAGPEAKVWIAAPGGSRSATDREVRHGNAYIRPLDLQCTIQVIRGAKGLACVPNSPRELPLISHQATEVQVDFRDLSLVAEQTGELQQAP